MQYEYKAGFTDVIENGLALIVLVLLNTHSPEKKNLKYTHYRTLNSCRKHF